MVGSIFKKNGCSDINHCCISFGHLVHYYRYCTYNIINCLYIINNKTTKNNRLSMIPLDQENDTIILQISPAFFLKKISMPINNIDHY